MIYYVMDRDAPVYVLLVYAKNQAADLSPEGRKAVTRVAAELKAEHRRTT